MAPELAAREDEGEDAHDYRRHHDDVGHYLEDRDAPLDDGLPEERDRAAGRDIEQ